VTWDQGDVDGSTVVDGADITAIINNWNGNYAPEPATMALLALGAIGVIRRRRK